MARAGIPVQAICFVCVIYSPTALLVSIVFSNCSVLGFPISVDASAEADAFCPAINAKVIQPPQSPNM